MSDVELLERLVAIPSPTGRENAAVAFLQRQARDDGFRVTKDEAGNFVAEAGRGDKLLLFVGHIDTVEGVIPVRRDNGVLWGRGAVDAKGPLVAAYAAARRHLDDPSLRIRIVGAVDEEGHSRGAKAVPLLPEPAWIINGEPSGAHGLTLGYKGIMRGAFRLVRERSHGAHPGATAVEEGFALWQALAKRLGFDDRYDSIQGKLEAVNTSSDGLHDRVDARFSLRLPPGVDPGRLQTELEDAAHEEWDAELEIDESMPGAVASKQTSLVAAFLAEIRSRKGRPALKRKTGTADFNIFAHRHPDVPIVAYGPGDAALDHTPHERLEIAEFEEAVSVLGGVFERLASQA